jgi:hypothetical protein
MISALPYEAPLIICIVSWLALISNGASCEATNQSYVSTLIVRTETSH